MRASRRRQSADRSSRMRNMRGESALVRVARMPGNSVRRKRSPCRTAMPRSNMKARIGGCLVTPGHELRPSGRAVYETALARYVGADDRSKTAAGEEALELTQSASEQIVNVASLRNARSKVGRRGIGIALDDRDLVEDVAQNAGGAHARQTAADHQSASGGHGPLPPRPANLAASMHRLSLQCRRLPGNTWS